MFLFPHRHCVSKDGYEQLYTNHFYGIPRSAVPTDVYKQTPTLRWNGCTAGRGALSQASVILIGTVSSAAPDEHPRSSACHDSLPRYQKSHTLDMRFRSLRVTHCSMASLPPSLSSNRAGFFPTHFALVVQQSTRDLNQLNGSSVPGCRCPSETFEGATTIPAYRILSTSYCTFSHP